MCTSVYCDDFEAVALTPIGPFFAPVFLFPAPVFLFPEPVGSWLWWIQQQRSKQHLNFFVFAEPETHASTDGNVKTNCDTQDIFNVSHQICHLHDSS